MDENRPERIVGLDAWRAVLMLFGIAYHGTMLRPESPFLKFVTLASQSCRMALFFALSGFLSALALQRHASRSWFLDRVVSLGTVTAFGLAVICPLTALAAFIAPEQIRIPTCFPQWYHVWFMVALLLYTPAAFLVHRLDHKHRLIATWESDVRSMRYAQPLLLFVIPLISLCLMQLSMALVTRLTPPQLWYPLQQLRPTFGYLPLFLLGFVAARAPRLLRALTGSPVLPVLIIAGVTVAYLAWHVLWAVQAPPADRATIGAALGGIGSAICPPAALVLLMRSALEIRRIPATLDRLAQASFTIYLVHLPIELAINGLFAWVGWSELGEWAIAVAATLLISLAIHERVVRRSPLLRLLFNGVLPRRTATRGQQSAVVEERRAAA
ncbi:acyltransferase family protein [Sphingomonas aerophila]|uniref:Glucan biosynthesis protein C n=1 Tax=Sphingomonas aerophila TaxID=1344948 RepID=A0A7W9BCG4_9SPHN|nr:acyltransferase family protein [Sphingomonas aerophila]MBB5714478.1 glucan biosynthesis protein C [Sphingomonas aerophila]